MCKYSERTNCNEKIVYKWLEKNKLTEETATKATKAIDDVFIDYCLYTNNAEKFIKSLEELEVQNES